MITPHLKQLTGLLLLQAETVQYANFLIEYIYLFVSQKLAACIIFSPKNLGLFVSLAGCIMLYFHSEMLSNDCYFLCACGLVIFLYFLPDAIDL
jgi:hypothetical protein